MFIGNCKCFCSSMCWINFSSPLPPFSLHLHPFFSLPLPRTTVDAADILAALRCSCARAAQGKIGSWSSLRHGPHTTSQQFTCTKALQKRALWVRQWVYFVNGTVWSHSYSACWQLPLAHFSFACGHGVAALGFNVAVSVHRSNRGVDFEIFVATCDCWIKTHEHFWKLITCRFFFKAQA